MALASCSEDSTTSSNTIFSEDNAITLTSGVSNVLPANGSQSRSATRAEATTSTTYTSLVNGTGIRLRVEGAWKKSSASVDESVIQLSHAAVGDATEGSTYNLVSSYDPVLYWDDYGTGDPNNSENTENGLNIYAVAIDGLTTAPIVSYTTEKDEWGSPSTETTEPNLLTWNTTDSENDEKLHKDLIVSNNLSDETTSPGRLTFAEHKAIKKGEANADEQARLVFKHVFSKLTFNLKAADGFTNYKFEKAPTVTLTRSKASETNKTYYCLVDGKVNIKKGVATASAVGSETETTAKSVTLKKTGTSKEGDYNITTEEAIVYPGTTLCSTENDIVAMINADNNIYYVTAAQIKAAIDKLNENSSSDTNTDKYKTKAGYNYVFNVTVKKTGIVVTATVTDWTVVTAENAEPKIDVTAQVGTTGSTATINGFSFYRMANEATGTDKKYNSSFKTSDYYGEEAHASLGTETSGAKSCTFKKTNANGNDEEVSLYWPDHQTHYHFRGIYPQASTSTDETTTAPHVQDVEVTNSDKTTSSVQAIKVANCKYDANSFPSNLMIGAPEITSGTMCGNSDHIDGKTYDMSINGICAREASINLNFRYMMSQVQVNLSTSEGTDKVSIAANTKVEIEGAENSGWVGIHNRNIATYATETKGYTMTGVTDQALQRHDCIIPQSLGGLTFKISVYDSNDKLLDVYRATIKDIKVSAIDSDGKVIGEATAITSWEAGKKYVYNLKLTKTQVKVTATITDWETKSASSNIWL